jgi:hypothetical protein
MTSILNDLYAVQRQNATANGSSSPRLELSLADIP